MRVPIMMLIAALLSVPAWAKGHGGGHAASGGHGPTASQGQGRHASVARAAILQNAPRVAALGAAGSFVIAPGTNGPHRFADCPARLVDGAFCPLHGFHVAGSFFGAQNGSVSEEAIPSTEGTRDSDLGPWIVFLWMGRAVAAAAHSLVAH